MQTTTIYLGPRAVSDGMRYDDERGDWVPVEPQQCKHNSLLRVGVARDHTWDCKLAKGHDGDHDPHANWRGHLVIREWGNGTGATVEIRHDHGYGSLSIQSLEDAQKVAAAILEAGQRLGSGT